MKQRPPAFPGAAGLLRGEVHDANSFYSGGSAGNAGLFASARDLFKLSREFFPQTATLLKADTIRLFWQNRTPWSPLHRSLGFKLNSSRPISGGRALSEQAIGHTGFTGTSLWLEPETQRQWIILSNRIHPRVKKTNFDATRRKLHRLLKSELGLTLRQRDRVCRFGICFYLLGQAGNFLKTLLVFQIGGEQQRFG